MAKRHAVLLSALSGLLLVLTACSTGAPINVNDQLWRGTSQLRGGNGTTLTVTAGFKQTGNEVRAKWAFNRPGSLEIVFVPTLTGTMSGSSVNLSDTDSYGDSGTFQGSFDASGKSLTGTLTITTSGTQLINEISMAYVEPLRDSALVNPEYLNQTQKPYSDFQKLLKR